MQCHLRGELMEQIFNLIGRQILDAEKNLIKSEKSYFKEFITKFNLNYVTSLIFL